jgi:hypothetical protein
MLQGALWRTAVFCLPICIAAGSIGEHQAQAESPVQHAAVTPIPTTADLRAVGITQVGKKDTDGNVKGTSSHSARKSAIQGLPLEHLNSQQRVRVNGILDNISYFRRLPTLAFPIDPEVYTYFVEHPDVAVSVWRAMKISKLELWPVGPNTYQGDAQDGTVGTIEVLYRSADKYVVICDGVFKSPLNSRPIHAQSLLILQNSFFKEADGTVYVTHRADLFVSFPSQTVETVARILSPVAVMMNDRTFTEISLFLRMMSMAMARRPDWVENIVSKMEGVPDSSRKELMVLTARVYTEAQKRALAKAAAEQAITPTGGIEYPGAGQQRQPPRVVTPDNRDATRR